MFDPSPKIDVKKLAESLNVMREFASNLAAALSLRMQWEKMSEEERDMFPDLDEMCQKLIRQAEYGRLLMPKPEINKPSADA